MESAPNYSAEHEGYVGVSTLETDVLWKQEYGLAAPGAELGADTNRRDMRRWMASASWCGYS
ncbi:hypothetical protein ACWDCB_42240 [Streptomyces sp. NPDC001178]